MKRSDVLVLAILGTLEGGPLHGYEIRKRLGTELGPFRTLSYGSLYPALRDLVDRGLIEGEDEGTTVGTRRSRITYRITEAGHEALATELANYGTASGDDDQFGVRFDLFARTDRATRLHVIEARRLRLAERADRVREQIAQAEAAGNSYAAEFRRHSLDNVTSEIDWLDRVIAREGIPDGGSSASGGTDSTT